MTLIAGAVLPDGALLAADCRVTWTMSGQPMATDFALKLIRLGDSNLLGFAGDVQTVQYFIPYIFRHLAHNRRDAVSVSRWLPRFFRRTYRALACQYPIGAVEFMVASSIRGRPTIVHPGLIRTSLEGMRVLGSANWLALRCLEQLDSPLDAIAIPDSNLGMLYVMRSPDFTPLHCPPLSVMAIGSGQAAIEDLERHSPFIMCGRPDRAPERFLDALSTYFLRSGDVTVGGILVMGHAVDGRVHSLPFKQFGQDGQHVEIAREEYGFVLRNSRTGQAVPLRYPSQVLSERPRAPIVFDGFSRDLQDYSEAILQREQEIASKMDAFYKSLDQSDFER